MTKPAPPIRVLLADDHPVVREGIRSCLGNHERVQIIGEVADGEAAVQMTRVLHPDVVLMDINMPCLNGMEATEVLRQESPNTKVLALTVHTGLEYVRRILRAGARGYVLKDASPAELLRAIEAVADGLAYFSPAVAQLLVDSAHTLPETEQGAQAVQLSKREREVLMLVAEGLTNKEMAARLGIGARTVEAHRERLMNKLRIYTAAGLTRYAISQGIVPLE